MMTFRSLSRLKARRPVVNFTFHWLDKGVFFTFREGSRSDF